MASKHLPCEICGKDSLVEVVPDGFEEPPPSFTITRTCSGGCKKGYASLTAEEMTKLTGLPRSGWPL
jgi:hypothetical protein